MAKVKVGDTVRILLFNEDDARAIGTVLEVSLFGLLLVRSWTVMEERWLYPHEVRHV